MAEDRPKPKRAPVRVGLAMAGGGPGGAIYEIGALRALEEALDGIDFTDLHAYVGVSAGAFIASCLANRLTTAQMCRAITSREPGEHPFVPEKFLTPSFREFGRRGASVPRLLVESVLHWLSNPLDALLADSVSRLGRALPVGVFKNEPMRQYLEKIFNLKDRTDDFRRLRNKLIVVAADLDSGQAVRFGEPGFDHVPISQAVQASTALPGLYPPVEIDGRYYVDGVLLKTLHASVALEAGVELLFCINPIVPVDTVRAVEKGVMKRGKLIDRGLPAVLSQALRTMVHSRMSVGMKAYEGRFDADIILFEPRRDDYRMFFTNIFGFSERRDVCQHAYESTRADLLRRYDKLAPALASHGITLRRDVLEDPHRDVWSGVGLGEPDKPVSDLQLVARLDFALGRLEELLEDQAGAGEGEAESGNPTEEKLAKAVMA